MGEKLQQGGPDNSLLFWCPGCETHHAVWCEKPAHNGSKWDWNGDWRQPTVSPSILVNHHTEKLGDVRCHLYLRQGRILYLSDCTHRLAGQTIDMEDVD